MTYEEENVRDTTFSRFERIKKICDPSADIRNSRNRRDMRRIRAKILVPLD